MNLFADLERSFAALLGSVKPPETPAAPEHSTDSTVVITGNDDIAQPADWQPWQGPNERAPLPVYPQRGFRIPLASAVKAEQDARVARIVGDQDATLAMARGVLARAYQDGLFEERRRQRREANKRDTVQRAADALGRFDAEASA